MINLQRIWSFYVKTLISYGGGKCVSKISCTPNFSRRGTSPTFSRRGTSPLPPTPISHLCNAVIKVREQYVKCLFEVISLFFGRDKLVYNVSLLRIFGNEDDILIFFQECSKTSWKLNVILKNKIKINWCKLVLKF